MAFVQDDVAINVADGGTLAFTSNVGAGSLLIATFRRADNTTICNGITDTRSNTWAKARSQHGPANANSVEIWYAHNANAGANTLTFDWSAAVGAQVCISEYDTFTGGVTLGPVNSAEEGGSTSFSHGSITTTSAVSVSIAATGNGSAFTVNTVGDSFTAATYQTRSTTHYKVMSATETHDCDLAWAASEQLVGAIANFYETSAAGANPKGPLSNPLAGPFGGPI